MAEQRPGAARSNRLSARLSAISVEPIGFHAANEQTFGRYSYANNNPDSFV
jgi:hypothetical protein